MTSFKTLLLAAALVAPAAIAAPAEAQVNGIGVVDIDAALNNSNAWKAAAAQLQTTYKPQIDQANARQQAARTELQPLYTAFETARSAPNANEATLRTQAQNIQTREQAANADIQRLTAPFARARAYVVEQLQGQLKAAVDAAAARKRAQLVLPTNDALHVEPAADLTADVTTELNRLVPSVSITPPANWQPGGQGGAAASAAAAPAATTPAPTNRRQPQGR